jgi:hypothetical protein
VSDEHRASVEQVRQVAEDLGTPGQDATPDEHEVDGRDSVQSEIRRRQAKGDDPPTADRDAS